MSDYDKKTVNIVENGEQHWLRLRSLLYDQISCYELLSRGRSLPRRLKDVCSSLFLDDWESCRIRDLEDLISNVASQHASDASCSSMSLAMMSSKVRRLALLELKALRLSRYQSELRNTLRRVMTRSGRSPMLMPAPPPLPPSSTCRPVQLFKLRDLRSTLRFEQIRVENLENQRKQQAREFANTISQAVAMKRTMWREAKVRKDRLNKALLAWWANNEREQKKERERRERERMKRLMAEDEDGYRKLIDEQKDERLAFLLKQTDSYVETLVGLVKEHQERPTATTIAISNATGTTATATAAADDDEYHNTAADFQTYYQKAHRIHEQIPIDQSQFGLKGNLKPYQIKGLEWLVSLHNNNLNGILADEMGLGKTIQTIALVNYLIRFKNINGPFLIIVPLSTLSNWSHEFVQWTENISLIIYKGNPNERKALTRTIRSGKFNVLLTTYDFVMKDKNVLARLKWQYMIIAHGGSFFLRM